MSTITAAESMPDLRRRFLRATKRVYGAGTSLEPGTLPLHRFRFPDGMLMVISFDKIKRDSEARLHIAVSQERGGQAWQGWTGTARDVRKLLFLHDVLQHFQELTGAYCSLALTGFSEDKVSHFWGPKQEAFNQVYNMKGKRT